MTDSFEHFFDHGIGASEKLHIAMHFATYFAKFKCTRQSPANARPTEPMVIPGA